MGPFFQHLVDGVVSHLAGIQRGLRPTHRACVTAENTGMNSSIQFTPGAAALLNVESWAAARALDKKGPVAQWLAPKAAAARAPLALVHTALVLEISAALIEQAPEAPVTKRAEALVSKDLDRLLRRALTMVRSLPRRARAFAPQPGLTTATC